MPPTLGVSANAEVVTDELQILALDMEGAPHHLQDTLRNLPWQTSCPFHTWKADVHTSSLEARQAPLFYKLGAKGSSSRQPHVNF